MGCDGCPTTVELFNRLRGSVKRTIETFIEEGRIMASPEVREKRLKICSSCRFMNDTHTRCKACGCYVELKSSLYSERCPMGYW